MKKILPFAAGLLVALAAGWAAFPRVIYKSRPQPVEFSHKVHAETAGQKCEDCHTFRDDGTFAGLPKLEQCAGCHAAPAGSTQAEKMFIEKYVTPGREPEWAVYAHQPENVFFSHATHVKIGKLKCEQCHRDESKVDKPRLYREDRISGYSQETQSMDACIDCHRKKGLEHSCMECHK